MKRIWTDARAVQANDGYTVALDGRPMRLPGGPALSVPHGALAEAIAGEWQRAGAETGTMAWQDVPLTRLAGTAQCRVVPNPAPSAAAIAAYGESDLLCYRAATPPALVQRQGLAWDPWLEWADERFGAGLHVTTGVLHVAQPAEALAALRGAVAAEDGWVLAGLGILVPALGSLVLGLAVCHGVLAHAEAAALALLDETFQAEHWGGDAEAEARRANILADVADAARYVALVRARAP